MLMLFVYGKISPKFLMWDVSYADYNQILLSVYSPSLHLINIHMCVKIHRGNHYIRLAYEISEIQG